MDNLLAKIYKKPQRPYSKTELKDFRKNLHKKMRLSDITISHTNCGHKYFIKLNGRKYSIITENPDYSKNNEDFGNCSVCWKIFNTDNKYKNCGKDLAREYKDILDSSEEFDHYEIELEKLFYDWLYQRDLSQ